VSGWPLAPLARLREGEAQVAANQARRSEVAARDARDLAAAARALAREARRAALDPPASTPGGARAWALRREAAVRATADLRARALLRDADAVAGEASRLSRRAAEDREREARARARAEALRRGLARHGRGVRARREAALDRDAEECGPCR
jgi:hypothetical protein